MDFNSLSKKIEKELVNIGEEFSNFQKKTPYTCPPDCGKCCYNPEISAAPFEFLPLALHLLQENLAEKYLEFAMNNKGNICILLNQIDPDEQLGNCNFYHFRPLVCRAFAVAGRKNKNEEIDLSICRELKKKFPELFKTFDTREVPFISSSKRMLEAIDPVMLEPQININEALAIMLEKILLWNSYKNISSSNLELPLLQEF